MKLLLMLLITGVVSAKNDTPKIVFEIPGVHVRDFALSTDGKELYMTMESVGKDASQIIKVNKTPTGWSEPEIASFSGQFKDLEPFLHPNGLQLFFASNRNDEQNATTEQFDIWQVERKSQNDKWGVPVKLNEHINTTDGNEFYPSVSSNGNLYFTATKKNGLGKEDIYVSRLVDGQYVTAELLPDTINSATYEFNAYINPDENMLFFSSFGRKDGHGGGDLYVSHKVEGTWQPAVNMGADINTDKLDYCPFYDEKNQMFFWTSNRSNLTAEQNKYDFAKWYQIYTSGENGSGKIYSKAMKF